MRHGHSPTEACSIAIIRLRETLRLEQRESCTVGLVALNTKGQFGSGSTISARNQHFHVIANPDPNKFQMAVWRAGVGLSFVDQGDTALNGDQS